VSSPRPETPGGAILTARLPGARYSVQTPTAVEQQLTNYDVRCNFSAKAADSSDVYNRARKKEQRREEASVSNARRKRGSGCAVFAFVVRREGSNDFNIKVHNEVCCGRTVPPRYYDRSLVSARLACAVKSEKRGSAVIR